MLKKLFLPLLAICALGFTLIHTNSVFATENPCKKYEGMTDPYKACINGDDYKKWKAEQAAEKRRQQIMTACENGTSNDADFAKCLESAGITDGKAAVEEYYQKINDQANKQSQQMGDEEGEEESKKEQVNNNPESDYRDNKLPDDNPAAPTDLVASCRGALFLGLTSWDCGTEFQDIDSEGQIPELVAKIAGNIFEDIAIIATYLAIGYIIYGGYLYIFANGDTGKVATGKKALNQAFVGLAITMSAKIIIETIRVIMLHADGQFADVEYLKNGLSAGEMVSSIIQWVIGIAGVVSLVFVVGGGIMYMTSAGEPSKLQTAKNTIKYALIGLVIVALAQTITIFMTNTINNANKSSNSAYIINEKEIHEKTITS